MLLSNAGHTVVRVNQAVSPGLLGPHIAVRVPAARRGSRPADGPRRGRAEVLRDDVVVGVAAENSVAEICAVVAFAVRTLWKEPLWAGHRSEVPEVGTSRGLAPDRDPLGQNGRRASLPASTGSGWQARRDELCLRGAASPQCAQASREGTARGRLRDAPRRRVINRALAATNRPGRQ